MSNLSNVIIINDPEDIIRTPIELGPKASYMSTTHKMNNKTRISLPSDFENKEFIRWKTCLVTKKATNYQKKKKG